MRPTEQGVYGASPLATAEHALFPSSRRTLPRTDHIRGHNTHLDIVTAVEVARLRCCAFRPPRAINQPPAATSEVAAGGALVCRGWRLKWHSSDSENTTELPQNPENGTTGSASKPAAGDLPQRLRPRPSGDSRPARWSSAAHHGQDAEARGRPRSGRAGKGCDGTPPGRKEGRPATCSGWDEPGGQEATRGQPATEGW